MVVRGEGACRENLASSCSARTHRMGDGRVSSPLLSSCLSVLSSVLSFLLPPGHLNLHYAPWPGSSSASGSGSVIQVQLVYPLMETGVREASGWAARRARKKWRKAAFLAPPQQGAYKLTNFAARNLVFPLIFKIPPSTVLTYYRPNFYIKKKDKCAPHHPKRWGPHSNIFCLFQLCLLGSGSQPGAVAPPGGIWKYVVHFQSVLCLET